MAALKPDPSPRGAKAVSSNANPLAQVMRDFEHLVLGYETGLRRSLEDAVAGDSHEQRRDRIRHQACRLAITELSATYTRKQIRRSLHAAEELAKSAEELLHSAAHAGDAGADADSDSDLHSIHRGHFRLYSTELFDMLGQPTDLRFGTLRFHSHSARGLDASGPDSSWTSLEMALNASFFVADSTETLPYHCFNMPDAPSLTNRGILSQKTDDGGAFPDYDSWLLFTFLGNGCLKLEVPIEMCADVYGGPLRGRENEEVLFWGVFVEDEPVS